MEGWDELIESLKYTIEYGLHCNDLSLREVESGICDAVDAFAEKNGIEPVNWDSDG